MDIYDKSIFKWTEPKEFFDFQKQEIRKLNSNWRLLAGWFVIPTLLYFAFFCLLAYALEQPYLALLGLVISLIFGATNYLKPYHPVQIRIYDDKLVVFVEHVRKKSIDFNEFECFKIFKESSGQSSFDFLYLKEKSGKNHSFALEPDIDKISMGRFLEMRIRNEST